MSLRELEEAIENLREDTYWDRDARMAYNALERKFAAFKKQLEDMRKEHERFHHCTLCDKYFERLLGKEKP